MKKIFYLFLAVAAGLSLAACNEKPELIDGNDGPKQYISFRIASASNSAYTKASYGTGTEEYGDGTDNEYDVKNVRFLFYQGGNFKTVGKEITFAWNDASATDITKESAEAKCVLEGTTAGEKPDQVLCFLNITDALFNELKALPTLAQALAYVNAIATDSELAFVMKDGTTYYFTMSNSVHQNADGSVADAVNVAAHIYDDEATAIGDPVTIYVERLAAKVEAGRKASATNDLTEVISGLDATDPGVATCKVEIVEGAWALNAVNRDAFLTKQIESSATWTHTAYPWMGLNNDHRSFWEKDNNYEGTLSDYAEDAADYKAKGDPYKLTNYSTNQLLAHVGKKLDGTPWEVVPGTAVTAYDENDLRARFCLPNTMGQKAGTTLADYQADLVSHPKKVGTHLIVLAQVTDGTDPVETFYVYSGNPCTEKLYKTRALNIIFTPTDGRLSADNAGSLLTIDDLEITKADFDTNDYIIEKTAADYTDGYVSVFPETLTKLYYYKAATNEYVEFSVSDSDPVYLATFGKAVVERANKYNQGLMYYAIPIEHANTKKTTEKDPSGLLDRYELGAYGVVRNHWYNITLGNVTGLGKGIDDPDEPIVPEEDQVWHLAATININAWHKLVQESDLK